MWECSSATKLKIINWNLLNENFDFYLLILAHVLLM